MIADVFRVFFLQNPGGPLVSRDFSNLETNDPSRFAKDEHTIFNPVRRALWEQFIQKNINNKAQLVILYRALAKSIAEEIDLQKNLIGQKQVIDVLALNAQLLNRIKFNLAR